MHAESIQILCYSCLEVIDGISIDEYIVYVCLNDCAFMILWLYDCMTYWLYDMSVVWLLIHCWLCPMHSLRPTEVNTVPWLVDVTMSLFNLGQEFSLSVGGVDCSVVKNPWICIFHFIFYTIIWLVEWWSEMTKEGIVTHFSTYNS